MLPWHADAAQEPAPCGLSACDVAPRGDASARMGGDPGVPPGPIPFQSESRRIAAAPDPPQRRAVMTILVFFRGARDASIAGPTGSKPTTDRDYPQSIACESVAIRPNPPQFLNRGMIDGDDRSDRRRRRAAILW